MDIWLEKAGPWVDLLLKGVEVTVKVVKGRPRLVAAVVATSASSLLFYAYITKKFNKFEKLGIPYEKGHFPCGSFNLLRPDVTHMYEHLAELHKKHAGKKYTGWFLFGQPVLNIQDPELLRQIMVKDFNSFVERTGYDSTVFRDGGRYDKIWGKMLTSLKGEEWKLVRSTFSPIFTSGKMKGMLGFVKTTSDNLVKELDKFADKEEEIEVKKIFGCYTMDGLASAAFGMDINSFEEGGNSVFIKYMEALFKISAIESILLVLKVTVPGMASLLEGLNINIWKKKETKFFYEVILSTIKMRREGKQERRNDLVDLMMDSIKQDLKVVEEEEDQYEKDMKLQPVKKTKSVDEDVVVATSMILMMAGYDTTATLLSYTSYALSKNPEVQTKLQEEVDEAFAGAENEFPDYSVIQGLPYLDMVVHETLRMYSPVPLNNREATVDYHIPGTEVTLKAGDLLSFSVSGLHRDPAHWSHPEEFYPEHFSKEEKATRSPYAFQAFGQGPRNCIGMRFALLEAKVALLAVCRRFTFQAGTKTKEPLRQDPNSQIAWPKGGIWVHMQRR